MRAKWLTRHVTQFCAYLIVERGGLDLDSVGSWFSGPAGVLFPIVRQDQKRIEGYLPLAQEMADKLQRPVQVAIFHKRTNKMVIYPQHRGSPVVPKNGAAKS